MASGAAGRTARWLLALIEASHPFPIAMVLCLTALVGIASAIDLDALSWGRLAVVVLAMALSQLAIGWTNDYVDRTHDSLHQPSKPVAAGRLDPASLPWLALAAGLSSVGLVALSFSWQTLAWFVVGTKAGLIYDVWLKDTRLSWLPYVVAFVVLPPYVWAAMGSYRDEFLLLYPVALPLALAAHLANALPDLESDREAGRGGIAVGLGRTASLVALYLSLETPLILALVSTLWLWYNTTLFAGTLAAYVALLLVAALLYRRRPFESGARRAFRPLVAGAIVFVSGLLAAL